MSSGRRRLWEKTRIALFRQSVDDREGALPDDWLPARVSFGHGWAREGAFELFAESVAMHAPLLPVCGDEDALARAREGGVPSLDELRLHHGTVWRWNRPVYDPAGGGHLIEMRALPAGPTVRDMAANAAFLLGLTLGRGGPRIQYSASREARSFRLLSTFASQDRVRRATPARRRVSGSYDAAAADAGSDEAVSRGVGGARVDEERGVVNVVRRGTPGGADILDLEPADHRHRRWGRGRAEHLDGRCGREVP